MEKKERKKEKKDGTNGERGKHKVSRQAGGDLKVRVHIADIQRWMWPFVLLALSAQAASVF